MEKGQKIAKESMSPEDIARVRISNWLVLYLICKNPGITAEEILGELKKSQKTINKEKPNFFLMFAGHDEHRNYYVYSLDDLLGKYEMETLISVSEDRKKYYVSNLGTKIVLDAFLTLFSQEWHGGSGDGMVQSLMNGERKC